MSQILDAFDSQLDFENLIEQVTQTNEPIFISGNNNQTAVLISETMWEEIQERMDTIFTIKDEVAFVKAMKEKQQGQSVDFEALKQNYK